MKKGIIISLCIVAALILIGVFFFNSIVSAKTITAQLNVEAGQVLVNGKVASGDVLLKQGDLIETKEDGLATVILYDSIVINLEPNTKITLDDLTKEHPEVSQESGDTWNKFTKVAGVSGYTIKSGNSVASVRGTAFNFENGKIITGEGEVDSEIDGKKITLGEGRVFERLNGEIKERGMKREEFDNVDKKIIRSVKHLKRLRERQISETPVYLKKLIKLSDEEINAKLAKFDEQENSGEVDALVDKSPVKIEHIRRIAEFTKEIQGLNKQRRLLNEQIR